MGRGKHREASEEHTEEKSNMGTRGSSSLSAPPDGGWGWMVVFASFLIHVIADGIVYSFGVFFVEFLDYFKGGKGETAWVGSLVPAVTYTVGPIASALTNRYGCRTVTIVGSIISVMGFIISIFANSIYYLYISFGIMSGVGFGLIYLPAIVSVANYFEKRRAFATGLAVCGSGFGTFIFAPLTKWLLDEYSWKGTILIQAGIILNVVVCGALFRPLKTVKTDTILEELEKEAKNILQNEENRSKTYDSKTDVKNRDEDATLIPANGGSHSNTLKLPKGDIEMTWIFNSHRDLAPSSTGEPNALNMASLARSDGALHRTQNGRTKSASPLVSSPDYLGGHRYNRQTSHGSHAGPMYRKDIFYGASLQNIPMYRSHPDVYVASVTSIPDVVSDEDVQWSRCNACQPSHEFKDAMREMLSGSLLKNPVFLLFAISNFFTSIGFNMPFIYLPDRAIVSGVEPHKAAFLLSVIGIANTLGRVIFGWLSDRKWVNRLYLYNIALTICGVATALSPLCGGHYGLLVTYAAFFGVFIGVYVSLTSIVLVDLLGLDHLTNSFGLLLLFQGAATFIGPPLAGWMFDWTGSYDISFYLNGTVIAFSGLMLFFIPCLQRHQEKKHGVSSRDIDLGRHVREFEIVETTDKPVSA